MSYCCPLKLHLLTSLSVMDCSHFSRVISGAICLTVDCRAAQQKEDRANIAGKRVRLRHLLSGQPTHCSIMWKLVILVHCTTLILRGSGQETQLKPEETWKPLDNPRNRDLFFRTLKAYFSGREFNLRKFPDAFSVTNDKLQPVAFYSDPVVSAFADYEEKKNSPTHYLKG